MGSAAFIVPRIGEHISNGLNSLRDNFNFEDSHTVSDSPICSPIFQTINESSPGDLITFHHQEEVVATNESQNETHIPLFDLGEADRSDLFSFDIDDINPSLPPISPSLDNLSAAFEFKPETDFSDIYLPDNLMDLIDEHHPEDPFVQLRENESFTNTSSEPQVWNTFNTEGTSECISDEELDDEGSGEFEEIKRPTPRKCRQKASHSNSSVCLHNEDLTHGKPGQRLIFTPEERRLLIQMGQRIPTHFPLTRSEERAIRTMRRKIRNKLSAKASRARRQEYVSSLESQVSNCHKENQRLKSQIRDLERTNANLVTNLRNARSHINQLLKGTYAATVNGLGLNSKSASQLQPLLPLTISRQGINANQSRITMKSGKPASLLLVALMILASAAVLPLPGLEYRSEGAASLKTDVAANDQSVLAGRSRVLLNQGDEPNFKVHVKNEPQEVPASIARRMDSFEDDDEIPVIKTKINMNRSAKGGSLVLPTFEEGDQFDPFILPLNTEKNMDEKTLEVSKKIPEPKVHQRSPPIPYSVEDL